MDVDINTKIQDYCVGVYDHFSIIKHFQDRKLFLEWDSYYEPKRFFSTFGIKSIIRKVQLSEHISINLIFIEDNAQNRDVAKYWMSSISDSNVLYPEYLNYSNDLDKMKESFFNNFNKRLSHV